MILLLLAALVLSAPPTLPGPYPVVIRTDQDAYIGTESIEVSLENRANEGVWLSPFLRVDRSAGDGSYTTVYKLRVVSDCPDPPVERPECVYLEAGERLTLPAWNWNTGGEDQCPPRRPGIRALKGVHRIVAEWCPGKAPERAQSRVKLVTWE